MTVNVLNDSTALAEAVAEKIAAFVKANPGALMCFAAGDTPQKVYLLLADKHKSGEIDLNTMWFVGLDEWVGLGNDDTGSCRQVMYSGFYDLAAIDHSRILAFDGLDENLDRQCQMIDKWITDKGGIALTALGIGMNAHVGFNEPGAVADSLAHVVALDDTTLNVGKKYFPSGNVPGKGITVGMAQLLAANELLLMASGECKAEIVKKALQGKITGAVPASLLRVAANLTVWLDSAAAAALVK